MVINMEKQKMTMYVLMILNIADNLEYFDGSVGCSRVGRRMFCRESEEFGFYRGKFLKEWQQVHDPQVMHYYSKKDRKE